MYTQIDQTTKDSLVRVFTSFLSISLTICIFVKILKTVLDTCGCHSLSFIYGRRKKKHELVSVGVPGLKRCKSE